MNKKFNPVLVKAVSDQFVVMLNEWLTPHEMEEIRRRNATPEYENACASHDFCDANMAMVQAFEDFGISMPYEDGGKTIELWNAAWEIARGGALTEGSSGLSSK